MRIIFLIILSASLSFSSEVLTDKKTGLTWQDNAATKYTKKNWQGALALCDKLHLDGHNDWRLPSIKELENIIHPSQAKNNSSNGFKHIASPNYYWSSDAHSSNTEFAWMMDFKRGYEYSNYKTYERYVRCVREEKLLVSKKE